MPDSTTSFAVGFAILYGYVAVDCLRTGRVRNTVVYPVALAALVLRPEGIGFIPLLDLAAATGVGVVGFALYRIGGVRAGLAKLAICIPLTHGAILGLVTLGLGFLGGAAVSLGLVLTRLSRAGDWHPLASFYAGAAALTLFWRFAEWPVLVAGGFVLLVAAFLVLARRAVLARAAEAR